MSFNRSWLEPDVGMVTQAFGVDARGYGEMPWVCECLRDPPLSLRADDDRREPWPATTAAMGSACIPIMIIEIIDHCRGRSATGTPCRRSD